MMRRAHVTILAALALTIAANANEVIPAKGTTVTVEIAECRNNNGSIRITLYDKEEDFLSEDSKTAVTLQAKIEDNKATIVFENIAPGEYAIALMHDEDNDKKMKKSLIGLPKEGIGMSNNARPKFGPPKWKDAVFEVGAEEVVQEIEMFYF
jgi:uncharacterized protein (DUF2141 family)